MMVKIRLRELRTVKSWSRATSPCVPSPLPLATHKNPLSQIIPFVESTQLLAISPRVNLHVATLNMKRPYKPIPSLVPPQHAAAPPILVEYLKKATDQYISMATWTTAWRARRYRDVDNAGPAVFIAISPAPAASQVVSFCFKFLAWVALEVIKILLLLVILFLLLLP